MASLIIGCTIFGISTLGYGLYSGIKAKYNKRKEKKYQKKVIEHTIKRGYPLQSNYDDLEKRLSNGEELRKERNPIDEVVYREIKEINEKIFLENQVSTTNYQQI